MTRHTLTSGAVRVDFDADLGGRITQVSCGDTVLLVDLADADDPVLGWGCYPMVPWAGRLGHGRFQFRRDVVNITANAGPHAIHGLGVFHPWNVIAASTSSLVARLDLGQNGWPWTAWCEQRISLGPDFVHFELSVHGNDREFPAQVGWHPWFRQPNELFVRFGAMYERDADHLTSTRRVKPTVGPWDDCFTDLLDGPRLLIDDVMVDLSSSCEHWTLYTEQPVGICVEPQSGPPNAFNNRKESELDRVGPARVLQHSYTWRFASVSRIS